MVILAGCRRRCYLPSDLCMREGVSDEDVLRAQNTEHVSNVVYNVATQAKVSWASCRRFSGALMVLRRQARSPALMSSSGGFLAAPMHIPLIGLLQWEIAVGCTHGDPPQLG